MMIDKEKLLEEIANGNVSRKKHPDFDIYIHKYTPHCVFEKNWNEITLACRGLVLDGDFNIIANCIPKFFNYEEIADKNIIDKNSGFQVFEKLDGSLIQVFMYDDKLIITSSNDFQNEYTELTRKLLIEKYPKAIHKILETNHVNFIFELIDPLTKVVVDYGNKSELYFIAARNTDGTENPYNNYMLIDTGVSHPKWFWQVESIDELLEIKSGKYINFEGFVVKFDNGLRVKFKFDEYFRLHKLIHIVSKKYVLECMLNDTDVPTHNIPDELFDEIMQYKKELLDEHDNIYRAVNNICDNVINLPRKEAAEYLKKNHPEYMPIVFSIMDNKFYHQLILKHMYKKLKMENYQ